MAITESNRCLKSVYNRTSKSTDSERADVFVAVYSYGTASECWHIVFHSDMDNAYCISVLLALTFNIQHAGALRNGVLTDVSIQHLKGGVVSPASELRLRLPARPVKGPVGTQLQPHKWSVDQVRVIVASPT